MIKLCSEYLSVPCISPYVIIVSHASFRVYPHSIVCLNIKKLLAQIRHHIWSLNDTNGIQTHNHLVRNWTLEYLAKLDKWLGCLVSIFCTMHLTVCYHRLRVSPCSLVCQNIKELEADAISTVLMTATGFATRTT